MAATQYGRLQDFHPETDSIKKYLEHVSLYSVANEVSDEKKVAVLLSSIGASTYALLSDLVAPESFGYKTLDQFLQATLNLSIQPLWNDSISINVSKLQENQ